MNRSFVRATTAVAAVSAAALFFPAVASAEPVSSTNCAEISTGTDANGWGNTFGDELPGTHSAINIPGGDSDGSLGFVTNNSVARQASYHEAGGVKLSEVAGKDLSFLKSDGNANWQIRVTGAETGVGDGFVTFVWVGSDGAGQQNATNSDKWWATRDLNGFARGATGTLAALSDAAGSETVVNHYGISSQPGGTGGTANVDNVSFNGCTTNFKATGSAGEDEGAFGSLGGFGLGSLLP